MNDDLINCININKAYSQADEKLTVLSNLSFSVREGERIGLTGVSGCGKSTLLHILAGLDLPDSGEVNFNGKNIVLLDRDDRATFRNKNIGFVYQFHHLLPEFSAIENVAFPLWLSGESKDNSLREAKEILDKVGLKSKEDSKPSQLSGGERQRVAIARSIINKPSSILMDEPTGNLDNKNVDNFMNLVLDLSKDLNISLIIATHDNNVSSRLDRVLNLE
ncbi:MAG: ABC transporter ATP-binding protein [Gammaproteobacteria bacterium]